jgi:anti-sigma B factor antagonist
VTMSERWIENITIIDLDGRITVDDDADIVLRDTLRNLLKQGRAKLVLNLERVPYIGSAGMGRIVHAYISATRQGGSLKLLRVTARVHDLLVITKLLPVFDIFDSEAEALASFAPASI